MVDIIPAEPTREKKPETGITFHFSYILLPAVLLVLSLVIAAVFYGRLTPEVAYHFEDGNPDRWMSPGAMTAWMIVPQFVFFLMALAVISLARLIGRRLGLAGGAPVTTLLAIMGNMLALPQLILGFAMLDIFLYNAYQIRLMPLWGFALLVMALGGIVLGYFFFQAIRQSQGRTAKSNQE